MHWLHLRRHADNSQNDKTRKVEFRKRQQRRIFWGCCYAESGQHRCHQISVNCLFHVMMSLPKGCVDWLVGTSLHDMFCILIPRYKESSPPPPVHNHIKKDNFFHVCTCFSDDMMAVNDSMCQCVMKWSRRTGGKDFSSWDGTVTVSWWGLELSVELCCVLPWSTDTFPPSSSRLGTHGTQHFCPTAQVFTHTQHNTKTGSVQGCGQKQVWKYFSPIFFMKSILFIDNFLEHSMM